MIFCCPGESSIFYDSPRLIVCLRDGGFVLKEQKEAKGSKILLVMDEKEFYSLIEERMEEKGFEVFETSPPPRRERDTIRLF